METFRVRETQVHGRSPRQLQRAAEQGEVQRLHPGIYAAPVSTPEEVWRRKLVGHLERGGPTSALSHRAAAMVHRFQGFTNNPGFTDVPFHDDITVTSVNGWRGAPAIRSKTLSPHDVALVDGLRVTSVGRTLADLGRFVPADRLEFAVEGALRGEDQGRPDIWDETLLDELVLRSKMSTRPGAARLALVLARRGQQRPTGSYAETELVQGLRQIGITLMRQPTIEICDRRGRRIHRYFPDFADLNVGLLPEVDGAAAHRGDNNMDRDDRRQNELMRGFHIIRFHAFRIHRDAIGIAREIADVRAQLSPRADEWTGNGVKVIRTADGARLIR